MIISLVDWTPLWAMAMSKLQVLNLEVADE